MRINYFHLFVKLIPLCTFLTPKFTLEMADRMAHVDALPVQGVCSLNMPCVPIVWEHQVLVYDPRVQTNKAI